MSLSEAIESLKNQDFAQARMLILREDVAARDHRHFLVKGLAELAMGDWQSAQATFVAATAHSPDRPLLWLNRGIAEENLHLFDVAIASYERCLSLQPDQGEAAGNLSNLYRKTGHFSLAEKMAEQALAGGASPGDALNSLGLALCKQGKFEQADQAFAEAMDVAPNNPALIANRANLAVECLYLDHAWPLFAQARAIRDEPVFRRDEGMASLLAGDYETGWPLYESRLEIPGALRLSPACPIWRGENLTGKRLLIVGEQGSGDVIQFCRFERFLPDEAELVWAVPRPLVRLLTGSLRGAVMAETDTLPACDYYAPMMSLPLLTRQIHPEPLPPYLEALNHPALAPKNGKPRIGLVWAGSAANEHDYLRSLPLNAFAPVFQSLDADFYAPFVGSAIDQIGAYPVVRLDGKIGDFADTAALIGQMDLLITVDTAAAHLAGAMGVKTFLLLPYCPNWRWGIQGNQTAWYSSLTLLRQPDYGDWDSVMTRLGFLLESCF